MSGVISTPLRRAMALAAFAVFGTVAAFASIAPGEDAALLLAKTAVLEQLSAPVTLLPSPTSYLRQEPLTHGDTLGALLARLGVSEADARLVLSLRQARLLRAGSVVTAEIRAGERAGELVWLQFAARDGIMRFERVGENLVASEQRAALTVRQELRSGVVRS